MDLQGDPVVIDTNDDLDDFFAEKDRKKKERQAQKKAKKAAKAAAMVATEWATQEENPSQAVQEAVADPIVDEDLANKLATEAQIYRAEDDEWLDPDREFAPIKKTQDKLYMMVAPTAAKMHDLSEFGSEKEQKTTKASTSVGSKSWSKDATVKSEEEPKKEEPKLEEPKQEERKIEEPKNEEPKKEEPTGSASSGGYVPPHLRSRQQAAPPAAAPSRFRDLSPPEPKPTAPASGGYVPPHLRRATGSSTDSSSRPDPFGSNRLAGSGLAASAAKKAPIKVMPNLESAEDFPTLG